jgi:fatty-acyl-CoA synthase
MEKFQKRHNLRIVQAWGMTETSPIAAVAHPPRGCPEESQMQFRTKTGRVVPGVDLRIMNEGAEQPWDGKSVGEIEVRGAWITGAYFGDPSPEKFNNGWLRTGDVGHIDDRGYVQITDRAKDVIKSGGEWISSVELENTLMAHPDVIEAAVIGIKDERWDERPLACVVLKEGCATCPTKLREFLSGRVAKWWLPEKWSLLKEIPKTGVGKIDKKLLRSRFSEAALPVIES